MTRTKKPTPRRRTRATGMPFSARELPLVKNFIEHDIKGIIASTQTRWQPKVGQKYWSIAESWSSMGIYQEEWTNSPCDRVVRKIYGVFRTKRAAAAHRRALLEWTTARLGRV